MSTNLLFAYGTIADPEFFGYLLKRKPVYAEAWLLGYKLLINPESGYLFAKPAQGHQVTGQLAEITAEELEILDLWEGVPFYQREVLEVQATAGTLKAFVYTQNQARGIAISQGKPKERASMLEEIKEFRRWLDRQQNH